MTTYEKFMTLVITGTLFLAGVGVLVFVSRIWLWIGTGR